MNSVIKIVNLIQNARGKKYLKMNAEKCVGCGTCKKVCRHQAITGNRKEVHTIDAEKCFRCYHCLEKCPKKAIEKI